MGPEPSENFKPRTGPGPHDPGIPGEHNMRFFVYFRLIIPTKKIVVNLVGFGKDFYLEIANNCSKIENKGILFMVYKLFWEIFATYVTY